jgi:hypothetical protein
VVERQDLGAAGGQKKSDPEMIAKIMKDVPDDYKRKYSHSLVSTTR